MSKAPDENLPEQPLTAVERFKARIGGRLTLPARDNSLGRTHHIRLFKTTFGHLTAHQPHPAKSGHQPPKE